MRSGGASIKGLHVMFLTVSAVLVICLFRLQVWAQQQEPALSEFIDGVRAGLTLPHEAARADAFMGLYNFEGADEEVRNRQDRILRNLFRDSKITFKTVEPLAELPGYVADGVRYGPNLQPSGNVVLDVMPETGKLSNAFGFTTMIPYGRTDDGQYRFIAMVKQAATADERRDHWITIMLSGESDTGERLISSGTCTLQQSDGTVRLIKVDDGGLPSYSVGWRGIGVTGCRIEKTKGSGSLRLQLMLDDEKVFDQTFFEDTPAIYPSR